MKKKVFLFLPYHFFSNFVPHDIFTLLHDLRLFLTPSSFLCPVESNQLFLYIYIPSWDQSNYKQADITSVTYPAESFLNNQYTRQSRQITITVVYVCVYQVSFYIL